MDFLDRVVIRKVQEIQPNKYAISDTRSVTVLR